MNLSKTAAVLALGAACAMPVMAQSTTAGASSQPNAAAAQTVPNTQSMGAGPSSMDTGRTETRTDGDRDLGWLGLLGLAGLLGLRRKKDDHLHTRDHRATGNVR